MSNYREFMLSTLYKGTYEQQLHHVLMGIPEEAGEIVGDFKKHLIYGKELPKEKIIEEVGDLLYYLEMLAYLKDFTLEEAKLENIVKLKKRYNMQ